MSKQPEQIHSVYKKNAALNKLIQRAQLLEKLNHEFQRHLPAQFSAHCRLANIDNDTIIVHVDNASFASLLRFQAPKLCQTLANELNLNIQSMRVKVKPIHYGKSESVTNTMTLPKSAASILQQTAACLDEGSLKSSLEKLAKRSD
jgi:hypothetical protein